MLVNLLFLEGNCGLEDCSWSHGVGKVRSGANLLPLNHAPLELLRGFWVGH